MADLPEPKDSRRSGGADEQRTTAQWHRMSGVGIEFVVAILLVSGIGWWLDGKFGTLPWLTLVGLGLGFSVGLWQMVKMARRTFRD